MVKIIYATRIKKYVFKERERERKVTYIKSHFMISFRNRPTRITNIIINTVNIAKAILVPLTPQQIYSINRRLFRKD